MESYLLMIIIVLICVWRVMDVRKNRVLRRELRARMTELKETREQLRSLIIQASEVKKE